MLSIQFQSRDPLDHACRAMDVVRRLGLDLLKLHTEGGRSDRFQIVIECAVPSAQCANTVVERIAGMPGVTGVRRKLGRRPS